MTIQSNFLTDTEYTGGFDQGFREHLRNIADNFYRRGRQLMLLSAGLAFGMSILIAIGVLTFLFPLTFTDVNSEYAPELKEVSTKVRNILKEQQESDRKFALAKQKYLLTLVIAFVGEELKHSIKNIELDPKKEVQLRKVVTDAMQPIINALDSNYSGDIEYNFTYIEYEGSEFGKQKFDKDARDWLRTLVKKESPIAILEGVKALRDVSAYHAGIPGEQIVKTLRTAQILIQLPESNLSERRKEFTDLLSKQSRITDLRHEQARKVIELQARQAELIAEGAIARTGLPDLWVRVLTVRIGAIVLFLFLTRILLETYRYTIALAAFYRARGDAIQLVGQGDDRCPVDPEDLAKLLISVAPDSHRVDRVWSPENLILKFLNPLSRAERTQPDAQPPNTNPPE